MNQCVLENVFEQMEMPNSKEIRGNIYLPENVNGKKVRWTSSAPEIISDNRVGKSAPGVVKRGSEDVSVILTCEVEIEGETARKEFEVKVLKAPSKISDDDMGGYLFGHFIGEEDGNGEQIYFALSADGLNFKDLNGRKPVLKSTVGEKGVRDPYIARSFEGDRFFLIATDLSIFNRGGWFQNEQGYYDASTTGSPYLVFFESLDLINWSEPRLINVAPQNAGMAWAPEIVFHEETGEYIIFFSSSIMDPKTKYKAKPNAIYYVSTRDFVHFSETKLFIDNQTDESADGKAREIIDTTIIKVGDYYYSASKDGDNFEEAGGIRILKSRELLNPDAWEKVLDLDELNLDLSGLKIDKLDNSMLEGPELFVYNRKDWADKNVPEFGLMADQYMAGEGYLPLKTTDLEDKDNSKNSWKILCADEYSFDVLKKRHGTILPITFEELARVSEAFR